MKKTKLTMKQGYIVALVIYFLCAVIFYLCAHEQMNYRIDQTDMLKSENSVGEILPGNVYTQNFTVRESGNLLGIVVPIATYSRENSCSIVFSLYEGEILLAKQVVQTQGLEDSANYTVNFDSNIFLSAENVYTISFASFDSSPGNAVTIYTGKSYEAGRADIAADIPIDLQVHANGEPLGYALCCSVISETHLVWGKYYYLIVAVLGFIMAMYFVRMNFCQKNNRPCLGNSAVNAFGRYRYLIKQLVTRDFKTKYKRSMLGVLWSFLNPLLMMTVQYIVFSTLFRSSVPNFALYLMIGIVCFNFFSECAGMCLSSITGNAALITKVYVPKYIYPVSRMISSGINLLLSFIPLVIVMLITDVDFSKSMILLPIPIILLAAFSLGIGMILATMMVFFRDTQFLWGVISTVWMYVTPVIYPESILPQKYLYLFKFNPLYHIVRMVRTILMDGISPEPKAYIIAFIMSFGVLAIGVIIFKKKQDKFVLNV